MAEWEDQEFIFPDGSVRRNFFKCIKGRRCEQVDPHSMYDYTATSRSLLTTTSIEIRET